jgi:hypothetical protein
MRDRHARRSGVNLWRGTSASRSDSNRCSTSLVIPLHGRGGLRFRGRCSA